MSLAEINAMAAREAELAKRERALSLPARRGAGKSNELLTGDRGWEIFGDFIGSGRSAKKRSDRELMDLYAKNALVLACVREIATSVPEARLRFLRRDTKGQEAEIDPHPILTVLRQPNAYMSWYDFAEYLVTQLFLTGKAFGWKWRSGGRRLTEMWPVPPDTVRIEPGSGTELIKAFHVRIGGKETAVPPEDMWYLRFPDPRCLWDGLSPLQAAARDTDMDQERGDYMEHVLENYGLPGGVASTEKSLTRSQIEGIRRQISDRVYGEKRGSLLVLHNGLKFDARAMTPSDLDFPGLTSMSETRICAVFGVPPILVGVRAGLEHATYSNYGQAKKSFWDETVSAFLKRFAGGITMSCLRGEGDDRTEADFDTSKVKALQEQEEKIHDRWRQNYDSGVATRNETRAAMGLQPHKDGDVIKTRIPDVFENVKTGTKMLGSGAILLPRRAGQIKARRHDGNLSRLRRDLAHAWDGKVARAMKKEFAGEGEDALKLLEKLGDPSSINPKALMDELKGLGEKWKERIGDVLTPFYYEMIPEAYELGLTEMGLKSAFSPALPGSMKAKDELDIAWDFEREELMAELAKYKLKVSTVISKSALPKMKKILTQSIEEGWGAAKLAGNIEQFFAGEAKYRAMRVARTETIRAYSFGAHRSYKDAGVEAEQWLCGPNPCEFCEAMDGKVVKIDDNFAEAGETLVAPSGQSMELGWDVGYPPLHPSGECTIIAVIE